MVNSLCYKKCHRIATSIWIKFICKTQSHDSEASIYILGGTYEEDKVNIFVIFLMFTFPLVEAHAIKIIGFENYFLKH